MALEMLTFVKSSWIKPLWKQLGRITGERKKELDRLRDEFVDPEQLRGLYIEPYLQDRNPADNQQDDLVAAAQQLAFERINGFFRGELPLEKDGRHQMFILSDAGMGKTSLLLMIKLMHLTDFWPKKYNCVLFKLGADTLERVQALPNKGDTVLLLDALDEDPKAWKRIKDRLLELLQESEDFRRVIISSRTQFFPEMEPDRLGRPEIKVLSGYHCPVLYLSPFSDEQVREFIERKLPLHWYHSLCLQSGRIRKERGRAAEMLEQMQDLRMRPMLLQHIDKLLEAEQRQSWNAYTVYEALIQQWLDREVRKLLEQHGAERKVPGSKELFYACLRVAEQMEQGGGRVISEDALKKLIRDEPNISWLEKFDLGGRSLLNRNSDRAFRFSHYTIQEFLIAWGIVHEQLLSEEPMRATDQLVRFIILAQVFGKNTLQIDLSGFSWQGYVDSYGYPTFRNYVTSGVAGPELVILPGGTFHMGTNDGSDESPMHKVNVNSFAIGCYPVTFAEYDRFCRATRRSLPEDNGWGREQRPVINVNWYDATAYCDWLSQETGFIYRLPTEAEWEYACRAGSESARYFGDNWFDNRINRMEVYAWYLKNSGNKTHSVGGKMANPWGLHDMYGNVWEWCLDYYQDSFYSRSKRSNPINNDPGSLRIMRGGSWYDDGGKCRSSCRNRRDPNKRLNNVGFRCVQVMDKQPSQMRRQEKESLPVAEQDGKVVSRKWYKV